MSPYLGLEEDSKPMNVNPYETPGEPEPGETDAGVNKPLSERPGIKLFGAFSMAIFIVSGSLLGMAYMLVLGARKLDRVYYISDSMPTVLLFGGCLGAGLTIAFITLLRVSTNAIRRRLNEPERPNSQERRGE